MKSRSLLFFVLTCRLLSIVKSTHMNFCSPGEKDLVLNLSYEDNLFKAWKDQREWSASANIKRDEINIKNSNGTNYDSHRELYWHERIIAFTEKRLEKAKGKQKKAKRDTFLERFLFTPMAFFSFMNPNSGLSNTAVVLAGYNSAFGTERGSEDLFELVNKLKLLKRKRERDQDPLRDEGWDNFVHQFENTLLSQTENFAKKLKKNAGKADAAFHEVEMKVFKDNGIVDKVPVPMQEPQKRSFFQRAATSINSAMGIGMNLGLPQILHFVGMILFSRKNDEEN